VPFRDRFDCLWCGTSWSTRAIDDLEGWAQLCPTCLGKAGSNPFLRERLRAGLAARAGAAGPRATVAPQAPTRPAAAQQARTRSTPAQPANPDEWFLRAGPYARGAVHDTAWAAELDVVTRWLDGQPLSGRIEEPAAGVGFFSPLLAEKGDLHASDPDGEALDRARERLVAHRLVAHLHVADPWTVPARAAGDAGVDAVVASFLIGRVRGAGLDPAAASLHGRLRRGGRLALIELLPDPAGGPPDGTGWTWHDPDLVEAAFARAGFVSIERTTTGRFFVLVAAEAR
jgi:hypothetical protein